MMAIIGGLYSDTIFKMVSVGIDGIEMVEYRTTNTIIFIDGIGWYILVSTLIADFLLGIENEEWIN